MSFSVIRACPACGTKNRVSDGHLADTGRCGSCKSALPPQSEPIEVDSVAFEEVIQAARVPILVDFWAAWCGPCRSAAPEVHALAQEMAGRALVLKVDTDRHQELTARFRIQGIPNFVVIFQGQLRFQQAGLVSKAQMRKWLENASSAAA